MPMIHRRALITGLLASVAAPALARLTQGATTVYYTPYVGHGVALNSMSEYEWRGRTVWPGIKDWFDVECRDDMLALQITTPRQIRP